VCVCVCHVMCVCVCVWYVLPHVGLFNQPILRELGVLRRRLGQLLGENAEPKKAKTPPSSWSVSRGAFSSLAFSDAVFGLHTSYRAHFEPGRGLVWDVRVDITLHTLSCCFLLSSCGAVVSVLTVCKAVQRNFDPHKRSKERRV
jgi:hypothetical protein